MDPNSATQGRARGSVLPVVGDRSPRRSTRTVDDPARAAGSSPSSAVRLPSPQVARYAARPMRLADLFPVEDVIVPFEPSDKWDAIRKLVAHLVDRGRIARGEA